GAEPGRTVRSGVLTGRWRASRGKGCRGPVARVPLGDAPGMGIGAGRAGSEIVRLIGPEPTGCEADGASGGCTAPPDPPNGGRRGWNFGKVRFASDDPCGDSPEALVGEITSDAF